MLVKLQESELEGLLFGRDEAALQQLGQEVAADGGGDSGSLADFLRSYAAGAGAAAAQEDKDEELDGNGQEQRQAGGGLLLYEDRQGGAAGRQQRRPVWEDPQDAALRVNVAARSQLRKLRRTEDEAELTGAKTFVGWG